MRAWTLESRVRYALVWTVVNFAIFIGVALVGTGVSASELRWVIALFPVVFLVHGWVWYPRAKRRLGGL